MKVDTRNTYLNLANGKDCKARTLRKAKRRLGNGIIIILQRWNSSER